LESVNDRQDIKNRAWEKIKENLQTSAKESQGLHEWKQHKSWPDKECAQLLHQRKNAKMQCLQDPNQSNVNNLNNIKCEGSNHFTNKMKTYLQATTDDLETNSKTKNITDLYKRITNFKKGYQPRTNIVMDEASDLVTGSNSIGARWRNQGVNNVRQITTETADPLVPEPSAFEVEMANEKLKRNKSPGNDQIPIVLINAGVRIIHFRSINLLTIFGIMRNCRTSGKS
jgi:hypothetical protein